MRKRAYAFVRGTDQSVRCRCCHDDATTQPRSHAVMHLRILSAHPTNGGAHPHYVNDARDVHTLIATIISMRCAVQHN